MNNTYTDSTMELELKDGRKILAPLRFIQTTEAAIEALAEIATADQISLDTETVARDENGNLTDLDVDGPGPLRVISMAALLNKGSHDEIVNAYVFDMAEGCVDAAAIAPHLANLCVYAWNANFDEKVLLRDGMEVTRWEDLMLYLACLKQGATGVSWYTGLAQAAKDRLALEIEGKGDIQLSYTVAEALSEEQIYYAAVDAVATLLLADSIIAEVNEAGVAGAVELENGARPFISSMQRIGIPFDSDGWMEFLREKKEALADVESRLAELTDGGMANLFGDIELSWKPTSAADVRRMLNEYDTTAVQKVHGRLLENADSTDNDSLTELVMAGSELAATLKEHRDYSKLLSTYGDSFVNKYVQEDGRVHGRYKQALVATGRLASDKPNMQNLSPLQKQFFRPTERPERNEDGSWTINASDRVMLMADLSQAELRALTSLSSEPVMLDAFETGRDMHCVTAGGMLGLDMDELKESDPKRFKLERQKGKTLNFSTVYGLGGATLARNLTLSGVNTTPDEGKELLASYMRAYPEVAKWLKARDEKVDALAANPPSCDWKATMTLHKYHSKASNIRRALRKKNGRIPSAREVTEAMFPRDDVAEEMEAQLGRTPDKGELSAEMTRRAKKMEWVLSFDASVVVAANGKPFSFESRTVSGRRRIFDVSTSAWIASMALVVSKSRKARPAAVRDEFAQANGITFTDDRGRVLSFDRLRKVFDGKNGKALQLAFVEYVLAAMPDAADHLRKGGLSDAIRGMRNAHKNSPIQGGVGEAVLLAYAKIWDILKRYPGAVGVQSVHDSIVLECRADQAEALGDELVEAMSGAFNHFFGDVPAVTDVEISASLDVKDEISFDELRAALGGAQDLAA